MAATKTIGGINVTISATTEKFSKGIGKARKEMTTFAKQADATTLGVKSFAAAIGGSITVGAMARFTKQGIDQVSALSDLSTKLGISTERLAGFQIAAEDSGVSQGTFERSVLKMTKGIDEASRGVAGAAKTYERLGINVEQLKSLAPDEQFLAISDAINQMTGQNEKLNATMAIFGTKSSDMVRMLSEGRAGMQKFQDQAKLMGLSIKDDVAKQVEEAGDKLTKFKRTLDSLKIKAAIAATPAIGAVDEALTGAMLNAKDSKQAMWDIYNPLGWMVREGLAGASRGGAPGFQHPRKKFQGMGDTSPLPVTPRSVFEAQDRAKFNKSIGELFGKAVEEASTLPRKRLGGFRLGDIADNAMGGWKWRAAGMFGEGLEGLDGLKRTKAKERNFMERPALSFAESGSVESYRQQAAIRRQSEDIAKKSLNVQEQIRDGVRGLADVINFPAANLGKG